MEIAEIKQKLPILQVLDHYGHTPNRNNMLCCPFHNDKTPSMQVYPETGTVYCFSSNCSVGGKAMDQIEVIQQKEGFNKHEAIMYAKSMLGYTKENKGTNVAEVFEKLQSQLERSKKATNYLKSRGLEGLEEVGSNHRSNGKYSYDHLKDCIVFPLRDKMSQIVSLYGRSFNANGGHYYLSGRSGLFPYYPSQVTKTMILTESVIDAATLFSNDILEPDMAVLACYGTNGFTKEHEKAIKELERLEQILIFFDGDDAGFVAADKLAPKLQNIFPTLTIKIVQTLKNDDINDIWVNNEEPEIFKHLIKTAKEVKRPDNKHDYQEKHLSFNVKGEVKHLGDAIKVTLQSISNDNGTSIVQKLDLYDFISLEKNAKAASKYLGIEYESIIVDWQTLALKLEQDKAKKTEKKEVFFMNKATIKECIDFLKAPNLLTRINAAIGKTGVVGEENNRLLLFLIASSYRRSHPLHALIEGSSGSGKTKLLQSICGLMPSEDTKSFTRVTESSFYNYGKFSLKNKCLFFEDIDGLKEEALLALRELQSNEKLISSITQKLDNGKMESIEKVVYGPIASLSCTTKGDYYEDNISRCFVIAVDESKEQTQRIIDHQNNLAKGIIKVGEIKKTQKFIANCLRLLQPYEVVNPYASSIKLPQGINKLRRLHQMYHLLVAQITYINQYQRKKDSQGRLIAEKQDLIDACHILMDTIVLKTDELDGSLRQFFEKLKNAFRENGTDYSFNRFEIMKKINTSKTQLHRFLTRLLQLEYLQQFGYANRGYKYKIAIWDQYKGKALNIKKHMLNQLENI